MAFGAFCGLAKEVTWGTAVSATTYAKILSESLQLNIEQVRDDELCGHVFEPDQYVGFQTVKGDIQLAVRPAMIGYFLRSCCGAPNTTGTTNYTHVYKPGGTAFSTTCSVPPYTFEIFRDLGASSLQYAGCVVNSLQFEFGASQKILRATAEILGKTAAKITKSVSPTVDTQTPFLWKVASVTIGGNSITSLETVRIKLNNNLEVLQLINGSDQAVGFLRTNYFTVEADLTFNTTDYTEYDRFTAQTENAFILTFTNDANTEIKFDMQKLRYTTFPMASSGSKRLTVGVSAVGKYDGTATAPITVTLKNQTATY